MKKTIPLFLISLLCVMSAFAQSKKEQIANLTHKVDSLEQVIAKERKITKDKVMELGQEISNCKKQIVVIQDELTSTKKELSIKETQILKEEKISAELRDTIRQLREENLELEKRLKTPEEWTVDFFDHGIQPRKNFRDYEVVRSSNRDPFVKFQKYPIESTDLNSWLAVFEVIGKTEVVYKYDIDPMFAKSHETILYKNGIRVEKILGYEWFEVIIHIPFLNKKDATTLFENLELSSFINTCFVDDPRFVQVEFGTKVSFGGGC
jgi:hypothetical protein